MAMLSQFGGKSKAQAEAEAAAQVPCEFRCPAKTSAELLL